jgi:hypothetical protein
MHLPTCLLLLSSAFVIPLCAQKCTVAAPCLRYSTNGTNTLNVPLPAGWTINQSGSSAAALVPAAPAITATIAGGTMTFACAGLSQIPQFAGMPCPPAVKLTGAAPAPGTIFAGLTWLGVLHVGLQAPGDTLACGGCAQDSALNPMPGEYPVATAQIEAGTAGTFRALEAAWTGYPALPRVVIQTCTGTVTQTPTQVLVACQ